MKTSTIVAASVGTAFTAFAAYAVYFDHRRRTDPEFRKALKRESKKLARAAKEEAQAQDARQRDLIKRLVEEAKEEGFPTGNQEREAFFMNEVAQGEAMTQDDSDEYECALCFYKALKVYPAPKELVPAYEKTIPKSILEILSQMIALDDSLNIGPLSGSPPSDDGLMD